MKQHKIKIPASISIQNDKDVLDWMCQQEVKNFKAKKKRLLASHVDSFTLVFGPHHTKENDGEYNKRVWTVPFKNEQFNIFSCKGFGTSYEIVDKTYEDINSGQYNGLIKEFLNYISEKINQ